jgi:hypothetical protein
VSLFRSPEATAGLRAVLSTEEVLRAETQAGDRLQRRFVVAHAEIRRILAGYLTKILAPWFGCSAQGGRIYPAAVADRASPIPANSHCSCRCIARSATTSRWIRGGNWWAPAAFALTH